MMKYLHVLSIGVQNTLVYRVNFLFRAAFGLVPLMGTLYVWRAIYAGKADGELIGAYTLSGMVSYYLLVNFVDALTAVAEDDWQIAADIKDGNISQFLLKPIDYLAYRLCLYLSGRAIYTSVSEQGCPDRHQHARQATEKKRLPTAVVGWLGSRFFFITFLI